MRRVLVVASLVIALTGSFIGGAVLFRGDDETVVEEHLRCEPVVKTGGCGTLVYDTALDICRGSDPDAVKVTLVLERSGREYDRRTTAWDCRILLRDELDRLKQLGNT